MEPEPDFAAIQREAELVRDRKAKEAELTRERKAKDEEGLMQSVSEYLAEAADVRPDLFLFRDTKTYESVSSVVEGFRQIARERGMSLREVVEEAWADLARTKHELTLPWYRVTVSYEKMSKWGLVNSFKGAVETVVFRFTGDGRWPNKIREEVYPRLTRLNRQPAGGPDSLSLWEVKRYETEQAAREGVGAKW